MNRLREIAKLLVPLLRAEVKISFREKGPVLLLVNPQGHIIDIDWFDHEKGGTFRIRFPKKKSWSRTSLLRDEIWRSASLSNEEIIEIFIREMKSREDFRDLFLTNSLSSLVDALEVPVHLPETSIGEE